MYQNINEKVRILTLCDESSFNIKIYRIWGIKNRLYKELDRYYVFKLSSIYYCLNIFCSIV